MLKLHNHCFPLCYQAIWKCSSPYVLSHLSIGLFHFLSVSGFTDSYILILYSSVNACKLMLDCAIFFIKSIKFIENWSVQKWKLNIYITLLMAKTKVCKLEICQSNCHYALVSGFTCYQYSNDLPIIVTPLQYPTYLCQLTKHGCYIHLPWVRAHQLHQLCQYLRLSLQSVQGVELSTFEGAKVAQVVQQSLTVGQVKREGQV